MLIMFSVQIKSYLNFHFSQTSHPVIYASVSLPQRSLQPGQDMEENNGDPVVYSSIRYCEQNPEPYDALLLSGL